MAMANAQYKHITFLMSRQYYVKLGAKIAFYFGFQQDWPTFFLLDSSSIHFRISQACS